MSSKKEEKKLKEEEEKRKKEEEKKKKEEEKKKKEDKKKDEHKKEDKKKEEHKKDDKDKKKKKEEKEKDKHKDKDKGKVKKINPNDEVANAINRLPIWAHEILEDTDDPFVEDFGDDITAPLKEIKKLKSVLKSFPCNMLFVFKYTNLLS